MRSILFLAVLCLAACNSSRPLNNENVHNQTRIFELSDILRSKAGVSVQGNGKGAKIRIRSGGNSFLGDSEPLFVIDGQPFNGKFADVVDIVNVQDIKNIQVLKSATDTAGYGVRGANGVIEIDMN